MPEQVSFVVENTDASAPPIGPIESVEVVGHNASFERVKLIVDVAPTATVPNCSWFGITWSGTVLSPATYRRQRRYGGGSNFRFLDQPD